MILEYGPTEKVKGLHWYMCELRSEKTIEPTMKRIGNAIPGIFRSDPIEIFVPVTKRDLDVFELHTGPYVFVRSTNFQSLLRLKSITGVVSLVTEGDTNRPSKAIPVEDAYVQTLIKQAEEEFRQRAVGIEVGSFVRILNGETRDYCGTVEVLGDGWAWVRVILRTKSILLETPIRNLLNISHVPLEQRVYYFCPLVSDLAKEKGEEGLKLIEPDLTLDESAPPMEPAADEPPAEGPKKHSRQNTATALVKKLVLVDSMRNPMQIAEAVVGALKRDEIKRPKNLFIVYGIIKDTLMKCHFKKIDSSITNYRDVAKKYGREYKFSAVQIGKIDSDLNIPVSTVEPCKDGRSKEARRSKKNQGRHQKRKAKK